MEGPYRDLGAGFARLTGIEGARRGPSRLTHVEDALLELLRNAREAGATHVFVASTLKSRRYRTLTVIDDGAGVPEAYAALIFEPGVTTRHLAPVPDPTARTASHHGAGLALYHLKEAAVSAELLSASSPTAVTATFDTHALPERALQSKTRPGTRPSKSNLLATAETFARSTTPKPAPKTYYAAPAKILAALLNNRIIHQRSESSDLHRAATGVGLDLSLRTVQRVMGGGIAPAEALGGVEVGRLGRGGRGGGRGKVGSVLPLGEKEKAEIAAILGRAARAGYVEVDEIRIESRPGEISVRARVYEPEEEYE